VIGALTVGQFSFKPLRPATKSRIDYSDSTNYDVEARLWQDPFGALDDYQATQDESSVSDIPAVFEMASAVIRERLLQIEDTKPKSESNACLNGVDDGSAAQTKDSIEQFIDCLRGEENINEQACGELLCKLGGLNQDLNRSYTNEFMMRTFGYKNREPQQTNKASSCKGNIISTAYFQRGVLKLILSETAETAETKATPNITEATVKTSLDVYDEQAVIVNKDVASIDHAALGSCPFSA
jgi:hypothetical protein